LDDVFDALVDTPAEAANINARSEILSALKAGYALGIYFRRSQLTVSVSRPRLNDLLQGKMAKFSLDALVNLATASGLAVHIQIAEAA
jgi:predicted XRE-type DNA-binding protein